LTTISIPILVGSSDIYSFLGLLFQITHICRSSFAGWGQ